MIDIILPLLEPLRKLKSSDTFKKKNRSNPLELNKQNKIKFIKIL